MGMVKAEFYANGNIKSYECRGIFMSFSISYNKKDGYIDRSRLERELDYLAKRGIRRCLK